MKVHVLFAQRVENYHGEFAPETLGVATEFMVEENADLLNDIRSEFQCLVGKEFVAIRWVQFEVDASKIRGLLLDDPRITARLIP